MEAIKFKDSQVPLIKRYANDAGAAFLTLKATGLIDNSTVTCRVETPRGVATAGVHPKCGRSGRELCSGDMLLEALVACAGVSLKAAATMLDIDLKSATVTAEGDVDLRGTLGVADDVPVGFTEIRLRLNIDTDASKERQDELLTLVERYCVIFNTIQNSPKTDVRINSVKH